MTATVTMMDLASCKKDFSTLLAQIQPWTLSHFVMWLDIKVAEYKVFGRMIMDNTPNDTPQWLRASADYLEQQSQREKTDATAQAHVPPPLSPQSALRAALPNATYEHMNSFATTANSMYTVSTVNSTVVSPSVSPAYVSTAMAQGRLHTPVETYKPPVAASPDVYAKPPPHVTQFQPGFTRDTQRIPSISHLSPKHIRQSHMDTMSLPVSLTPVTIPVSLSKEMMQLPHLSKESLTTMEVETQIAVLESQIAAVNRNLKHSVHATQNLGVEPVALNQTPSKPRSRKVDPTDEASAPFVPPPYPKKTRQQSPVGNRVSGDSSLPPLHSSMDMLARIHRLDSDSIPESLRSQNIQSTLEAFEALRTQTFPPNPETIRTPNEVETVQNTAQDMSMHHAAVEREYSTPTPTTEREPVYPVSTEHEQIYAVAPVTVSAEQQQPQPPQESVYPVKIESETLEENGVAMRAVVAGTPEAVGETAGTPPMTMTGDNQNYNMAMYASQANATPPANADDKLQQDLTIKKMRRKFLESMKNSNPKYYSHQIQQIIPFPDKFPVSNLDYGLKALQMIQTGEITRAGKIQLIDTIFHELIKYTGLYPTPTQKMAVANSIVETFPTLAAKMKASHISPADSWYVILCDKFRNERRGLGGAGASPRVGKVGKMPKDPDSAGAVVPGSMEAPSPSHMPGVAEGMMGMEGTEDGAVEVRTEEVETSDETSQHAPLPSLPPLLPPPLPPPAPPYTEPSQAYQQQQQQQQSYPAPLPQDAPSVCDSRQVKVLLGVELRKRTIQHL